MPPTTASTHYVENLLPRRCSWTCCTRRRRTLAMDLRILVWTAVAVVLRRDVAVGRETGRLSVRRRPVAAEPAVTEASELARDHRLGAGMSTAATRQRGTRPNRWSPATTKVIVLAGGQRDTTCPVHLHPAQAADADRRPLDPRDRRRPARGSSGFTDITLCVGYLSHLIRAVFENGAKGKAPITYVQEEEALGTAGPLRLVEGVERHLHRDERGRTDDARLPGPRPRTTRRAATSSRSPRTRARSRSTTASSTSTARTSQRRASRS